MSDCCPVFSGPDGQHPTHGQVSCYPQLRRAQPPKDGHRWSRAAARHLVVAPYARQGNARHQCTCRWLFGCIRNPQSDRGFYRIVQSDFLIHDGALAR